VLNVGILYLLITGIGLCLLRHWAWLVALCGLSVSIIFSLVGLIQGSLPLTTMALIWVIAGGIIWYFTGNSMKQAFGSPEKISSSSFCSGVHLGPVIYLFSFPVRDQNEFL